MFTREVSSRLMIISKVTKKQGFTFSLETAFLEKPQGSEAPPSLGPVRVKINIL